MANFLDHLNATIKHSDKELSLPKFSLDNADVTVLESPSQFRQALMRIYDSAKRRIALASLYIGTGSAETEIIDAITASCVRAQKALLKKRQYSNSKPTFRSSTHDEGSSDVSNSTSTRSSDFEGSDISPAFKVDILIDALRGQRQDAEGKTSLSVLHPLLKFKYEQNLTEKRLINCEQKRQEKNQKLYEAYAQEYRSLHMPTTTLDSKAREINNEDLNRSSSSHKFRAHNLNPSIADQISDTPDSSSYSRDATSVKYTSTRESKSCLVSDELDFIRARESVRSNPISTVEVQIGCFQTPLLNGILKKILPTRCNEILGVFHTKIFLADDSVILTGANLSETYLTNRQDRYILIERAEEFATFLHGLVMQLQNFSYQVEYMRNSEPKRMMHVRSMAERCHKYSSKSTFNLKLKLAPQCPNPELDSKRFKEYMSRRLLKFLHKRSTEQEIIYHNKRPHKTCLHVAVQSGFISPPICHEERLLSCILARVNSHESDLIVPNVYITTSIVSIGRSILKSFKQTYLQCCSYASSVFSEAFISLILFPFNAINELCSNEIPQFSKSISYTSFTSSAISLDYCPVIRSEMFTFKPQILRPLSKIVLSSGYLNMPSELLSSLVSAICTDSIKSELSILVASPEANSFFESSGLSKFIPPAYSYIVAQQMNFLQTLWLEKTKSSKSADDNLKLFEYFRDHWSFHSKGLWLYDSATFIKPFATIIGSSNFGLRSKCRDLDVSFYIETEDPSLQDQLYREVEQMQMHCRHVRRLTPLIDQCPSWLRFFLKMTNLVTFL